MSAVQRNSSESETECFCKRFLFLITIVVHGTHRLDPVHNISITGNEFRQSLARAEIPPKDTTDSGLFLYFPGSQRLSTLESKYLNLLSGPKTDTMPPTYLS